MNMKLIPCVNILVQSGRSFASQAVKSEPCDTIVTSFAIRGTLNFDLSTPIFLKDAFDVLSFRRCSSGQPEKRSVRWGRGRWPRRRRRFGGRRRAAARGSAAAANRLCSAAPPRGHEERDGAAGGGGEARRDAREYTC